MALQVRLKIWAVMISIVVAGANAWAVDAQLEQAHAMLKEGKAAQAYALLEPQEFNRAGEIDYDTLLGIAALDGGKPDKATLAFERVLALDPNSAGVRLDMARAYFALGDYPRAKAEIALAAQNNPPPAARMVID